MKIYPGTMVLTGDVLNSYQIRLSPGLLLVSGKVVTLTKSSASGAWPDATNTGTTGTLTAAGDTTSSANGQTIQNLDVASTGGITIAHNNVTVRNCRVDVIGVNVGCTGAIIEDCNVGGALYYTGIVFEAGCTGGIARRNNIHTVENGISVACASITIEDNYFHDLFWADGTPHYDLIQMNTNAATGTVIDHNTLNGHIAGGGEASACITMTDDPGFTITNNKFSGAAYQLRIEGTSTGGTVSGNTFIADYGFGYVVDQASTPFTNNTFDGVLYATGHP